MTCVTANGGGGVAAILLHLSTICYYVPVSVLFPLIISPFLFLSFFFTLTIFTLKKNLCPSLPMSPKFSLNGISESGEVDT